MTRLFAAPHPLAPPNKNIVICLDGTGNRFEVCNSNVVKLFQVCARDHSQIAYYDPGVGTLGDAGYKTSLGRRVNAALGSALGVGLMKNVEEAYAYLMAHHAQGDRIYIFGFSRGAFTARVLAGFINRCGLFEKGCQNLIPYAMESFIEQQNSAATAEETQDFFRLRSSFRRTFGRRFQVKGRDEPPSLQTPIHFLGLWDTVKSYGNLYNPSRIPRESVNESVGIVRHAMALDERRAFFPQMHWRRKGKGQDVREVWFAGVHGDVGGTPRETGSGLSKITLDWMLCHAVEAGLQIDGDDYLRIVHGVLARADGYAPAIAKPDPAALRHESLTGPWWLIEALPWRRNDGPEDGLNHGPLCWWRGRREQERMRAVPGSAVIHGSTLERIAHADERYQGNTRAAAYRPGQLPLLTGDGHLRLAEGLPLLIAEPDQQTQRLLLLLPDGSGEVLMHRLSRAECQAWPTAGCGDGLQALAVLALATGQAIREALPASVLTCAVRKAIETARESLRFAANSPAGAWLEAFTVPASAAAASGGGLTRPGIAKRESALRDACAPLDDRLVDARAVVRAVARWANEVERATVPAPGTAPATADQGTIDLSRGLYLARTGSGQSGPGTSTIDALLAAFEGAIQAGIALLASDRAAGERGASALDAALRAAFERALDAWIALRAPAGIAPSKQRRAPIAPLLARLAVLGAVGALGAPEAAKRDTLLRARLKNVQSLRACGVGRCLAVAQGLHPDEAVQMLARSFKAVVKLVDWPAAFAEAATMLVRGAQDAAGSTARGLAPLGAAIIRQRLDEVIEALSSLDLALSQVWLAPGHREGLTIARGHLYESLVTWADRL